MKTILTATVVLLSVTIASAENWPAWRGADGSGVSTEKNLPLNWTTSENVRWKVPLPEPCNSTPIVWEDRVFLTQGVEGGKQRQVIALQRQTGKILWPRIDRIHPAVVHR